MSNRISVILRDLSWYFCFNLICGIPNLWFLVEILITKQKNHNTKSEKTNKQTNKQTKKQIKDNKIKHFFISIILVLKVKVKTFIVEPLWTPVSNIWILLYLLMQFPFTARETKPDYFHQEVNEPISSRVSKQFKTYIEKGHEKVLGNHKTEYKQSGKNSRNLKEINHQTFNKISTWSDSVN